MLTFASTNRLVTEPELPCVLSVVRVTLTEAGLAPASPSTKCQIAVALAVMTAAEELLTWNVHVPVLPPLLNVGEPHVLFETEPLDKLGVIDVIVAAVPDANAFVVTVNV